MSLIFSKYFLALLPLQAWLCLESIAVFCCVGMHLHFEIFSVFYSTEQISNIYLFHVSGLNSQNQCGMFKPPVTPLQTVTIHSQHNISCMLFRPFPSGFFSKVDDPYKECQPLHDKPSPALAVTSVCSNHNVKKNYHI